MEHVANEAQLQGNKVGFKIFCQLLLQFYPDFDINALEAFITLKVVETAISKVEEEVVATQKEAIAKEVEEVSVGEAMNVEALGAAPRELEVAKVLEDNEAH